MDYYYDYTYTPETTSVDPAVGIAAVGLSLLFFLFFVLIGYVIYAFLLSRIFKKAGVEQWIAWVPIYNVWKLLEIGGQQGFWAVLMLIPFVNIISAIFVWIAMFHIGKKLQKDDWFVLLAIFIPLIWFIWLAFDDSKWQSNKKTVTEAPKKTVAKKTVAAKSSTTKK